MKTVSVKPPVGILCRKPGGLLLVFLIANFLFSPAVYSQIGSREFQTIHVKFKEQFKPAARLSGISIYSGISKVDNVSRKHNALTIRRIFPDAGVFEAAHEAYGLHLWYEIKFEKGVALDKVVTAYRNLSYFYQVEECKEYSSTWNEDALLPTLPSGTNDPLFSNQWHYNNTGQTQGTSGADINLLNAWKKETGSPNVIVAVIDEGIDIYHPDLKDAIWVNADEIPNNNIDDDHNGYVDDVNGYGFGDRTGSISPDGHATHVAGVIGAVSNNGIGVSGIAGGSGNADGVRLMSCASFGRFGIGGFEAAMVYAADNGAVISQNSWGGGSTAIEAAIDYFVQRAGYDNSEVNFDRNIQTGPMAGGLVIFAAGNDGSLDPNKGYPGSYSGAYAVASTDSRDVRSNFSNFGSWVDISAPGSNIFSTYAGNAYRYLSGTSMACPHVSGVAALVVSNLQSVGLKPRDVWDRLRLGAVSINAENPDLIGLMGAGRLDALIALQAPEFVLPGPIVDLHAKEVHSSSIILQWTASGNDGNVGIAASYDLRYSTNPISDQNFDQATKIKNLPDPPLSGQQVEFNISNLVGSSLYYFAIKSKDFFNTSLISNVFSVTTAPPPAPQVITTSLAEELFTGGIATRKIVVKNLGGDDLKIRLGVPDILPTAVGLPTGARARLFAVNTLLNTIEELNTRTGAVINSIPMPESSSKISEGLAFDGVNLYYANSRSARIYKLNAQTGQIVRSFLVGGVASFSGLAWSGRYLYASGANSLFEIDSDNGVVQQAIPGGGRGITFSGKRGTLYISDRSILYEIDVETKAIVNTLELAINSDIKELAYSSVENVLYVSDGSATIKAIDPGTGALLYTIPNSATTALAADEYKPGWLSIDEQVITIPPGASADASVTFVATELPKGQFAGNIRVIAINSNTAPIIVSATLLVTSAPDIETNSKIDFGKRFIGFPIDTVIFVQNRGFSVLNISDIHSNDGRVTTSLSTATLAAGEQVSMKISVMPAGAGIINTTIDFASNDPDELLVSLPIKAETQLAPAIQFSPASLTKTLSTGGKAILNFAIENTGGSDLGWDGNFTAEAVVSTSPGTSSSLGDFTLKSPSPKPLRSLGYDPQSALIYAVSNNFDFYKYDPVADSWNTVGQAPSDVIGQSAYLNGKLYFYGISLLNIYSIQTNSWSSVPFPVPLSDQTGSLTTDGQYLYLTFGAIFYRYEPNLNLWLHLADIPRERNYTGLSFQSGVVYAHESSEGQQDGNTSFFKYYVASNTWLRTANISGKTNRGSAIDPAEKKYYVAGSPYAQPEQYIQLSILDIIEGVWERKVVPFSGGFFGDLILVGKAGVSGIYFNQSEGTGFARLETNASANWISVTPTRGNITPGDSQMLTVNLDATGLDAGIYKRDLRISNSRPPLNGTVPVTLTVIGAPDISIDKFQADLGDVEIGRGSSAGLSIRNKGTDALVISSDVDRLDFYLSTGAFTLPVGEEIFLYAYFNPRTSGQQTGTFTFHTNDPDAATVQFTMKGNGVTPPVVTSDPSSISISISSGDVLNQALTINNAGQGSLEGSFWFNGDNRFDIWVKGLSYLEVPGGQSKTLGCMFDASGKSAGIYSATIECYHHGYKMIGIPVTMNVNSAPGINIDRKSLNYGDRYIGKTYDSTIQIRNNGVLPLVITNVDSDNSVFVPAVSGSIIIQPGYFINVLVRFSPTSISAQTGNLTIRSNDPTDGTYIIPLFGNGVGVPVIVSSALQLTVSAGTNEVQTQTFTLSNPGGSVLKWNIVGQSSPRPSSIDRIESLEEPLSAGNFTLLNPTATIIISPVVDPLTGRLYAQSPYEQRLQIYNPGSSSWKLEDYVTIPDVSKYQTGGSVFLNSKMYSVYSTNSSTIGVYDKDLKDWTSIPNKLGSGTNNIASDGTLLYLAGGGSFKSYNPKTKIWNELPLPTIDLNGNGGLSYFEGAIYAHEGNGIGFARYVIATQNWEKLVSLPDPGLLGSAIDPVRKRYYACGKNSLYEYDIASDSWNLLVNTLFETGNGGLSYLPTAGFEGVYFLQGILGNGFARYEPLSSLNWLRISPFIGELNSSGSQSISVNFNAFRLNTGVFKGNITINSNDPSHPILTIPITFNVTNSGPVIEVPVKVSGKAEKLHTSNTTLRIKNKGLAQLQWSIANTLPGTLTTSTTSGTVAAGDFADITITFNPKNVALNLFDYTLDFNSNDIFYPKVSTKLNYTIFTNRAPVVSSPIQNLSVGLSQIRLALDVSIGDPDNDVLVFSASSANPAIASVSVSGTDLIITTLALGTTNITAKATDPYDLSATTTFSVLVRETVTGIISTETGLLAFPNPFDKDVLLQYYNDNPGMAQIYVYDTSGKIVLKIESYEVKGKNEIAIDGRQFAPGIYNCRLLSGERVVGTVRIVRN